MAVSEFKRKLKELEAIINVTLKETIDKNKDVLIDIQTNDQINKGEDSNGKQFIPKYAISTKLIKKRKGQPTNRVTLKDTGDFYKSIEIDTSTTQAIITANVEYFKYLVAHYDGNIILGIQNDLMREFLKEYFRPNLKKNFRAILSK